MKSNQSTLKADDGSPLELKEGILLDQEGNPVHSDFTTFRPQARIKGFQFNLSKWVAPVLFMGIVSLILIVGFTVFGSLISFFLIFWGFTVLLRLVFKTFHTVSRKF